MKNKQRDLSGQLAIAMMTVSVICLMLSVVMFYVVYGTLNLIVPNASVKLKDIAMNGYDVLALTGAGVTGLLLASFTAFRLAKRIARPLRSVARAARRIANGNLEARARHEKDAPSEAAALINDFNRMADQLENMATSIVTWNAQIAHELRTPLTILNGRLQGLVDGVFVADEKTLRGLLSHVGGLRRLVEDLRIVSLSDSGHIHLQIEAVDIAVEIEGLVYLVKPELEAADFTIALNLDRGMAKVDVARTRQAILALIENARKHATPCCLRVTLQLLPDIVRIEVVDDGPGLPVDFVSRAFEQFERAPEARQDGRTGSGLGLSVVQAIARAHGGKASYRYDGNGSAFVLEIPRWAEPASVNLATRT